MKDLFYLRQIKPGRLTGTLNDDQWRSCRERTTTKRLLKGGARMAVKLDTMREVDQYCYDCTNPHPDVLTDAEESRMYFEQLEWEESGKCGDPYCSFCGELYDDSWDDYDWRDEAQRAYDREMSYRYQREDWWHDHDAIHYESHEQWLWEKEDREDRFMREEAADSYTSEMWLAGEPTPVWWSDSDYYRLEEWEYECQSQAPWDDCECYHCRMWGDEIPPELEEMFDPSLTLIDRSLARFHARKL